MKNIAIPGLVDIQRCAKILVYKNANLINSTHVVVYTVRSEYRIILNILLKAITLPVCILDKPIRSPYIGIAANHR